MTLFTTNREENSTTSETTTQVLVIFIRLNQVPVGSAQAAEKWDRSLSRFSSTVCLEYPPNKRFKLGDDCVALCQLLGTDMLSVISIAAMLIISLGVSSSLIVTSTNIPLKENFVIKNHLFVASHQKVDFHVRNLYPKF